MLKMFRKKKCTFSVRYQQKGYFLLTQWIGVIFEVFVQVEGESCLNFLRPYRHSQEIVHDQDTVLFPQQDSERILLTNHKQASRVYNNVDASDVGCRKREIFSGKKLRRQMAK